MISATCFQPGGFGCGAKAGQATRNANASRFNSPTDIGLNGLACEPSHTVYPDVNWPTFFLQLQLGEKRNFISDLRPALLPLST
jgi:hypothetical protein